MAAAIADLAERARAKRLQPDEVHGGTFTITNPGQFGAVLATPIINQPQVGDPRPRGDREAAGRVSSARRRTRASSRGDGRFDRDPADDLSLHVVGPPGAGRGRRGPVPRRRSRRGWRNGRARDERSRRKGATGTAPRAVVPPADPQPPRSRRCPWSTRSWSSAAGPRSGRYVSRRRPLDRARPGAGRGCACGTTGDRPTGSATRCGSRGA